MRSRSGLEPAGLLQRSPYATLPQSDTHDLLDNLEPLDRLRVVKLVRRGADRRDRQLALLIPADHLVVEALGVLEDAADDGVALGAHEPLRGRGDDLDGVGIDVDHCGRCW